jgi:hypothetical protein
MREDFAMTYTGQCLCGAVKLTITAAPASVRQCWCRQCQTLAAGGPTNNAIFPSDAVQITGALASSRWEAASGNTLSFYFCAACGTQIYGQSSARLHLKTTRLGVIDQPHDLRPQAVIWTQDAPAWAVIDPALEQWPQQPPPPPPS